MDYLAKSVAVWGSSSARRVLLTLIGIALVVFGVGALKRGLRSTGPVDATFKPPAASGAGNDLTVYLEMAEALLAGRDPVAGTHYPPFTAIVFLPLAALPTPLAHAAWYVINASCLLAIAWLIGRHSLSPLDGRPREWLFPAFALVFFVLLQVLQNHFLNGQINLLVVLACTLFYHWWRGGRPALAALALAVAISLKLSPAILLGFLIFRRSFAAFAWTLAWTAILNLLPGLFLGVGIFEVLSDLSHRLAGAFAGRSAIPDKTMFFTLSGLLHWAAEQTGWLRSGETVPLLKVAGALLVLGSLCLREWRAQPWKATHEDPSGLACYLLATLLLLPVSETHHLVFAFPALLLLVLASRVGLPHACASATCFAAVLMLLLLGRVNREGPAYCLAIVCLYAQTCCNLALVPSRVSHMFLSSAHLSVPACHFRVSTPAIRRPFGSLSTRSTA